MKALLQCVIYEMSYGEISGIEKEMYYPIEIDPEAAKAMAADLKEGDITIITIFTERMI